jgi:hypothetical protein
MEIWKTLRVSHIPIPPATTTDNCPTRRYTNIPPGTKNRSGHAWPEFGNTFAELKDLAAAAGRRIRYLDQDTEIGDKAEYGIVLLER